MKDHKMRQIINDLYLLFLRIMNLASIFYEFFFDLFLLRFWDSSRPSIKALIMSSLIFLVLQGGGGGLFLWIINGTLLFLRKINLSLLFLRKINWR